MEDTQPRSVDISRLLLSVGGAVSGNAPHQAAAKNNLSLRRDFVFYFPPL
jgi:hypothetical protein